MTHVERVLARLGVDGAVGYTVAYRGWQLAAGLVTVLLVGHWLSPIAQGVFFTYMSLVALQVLFELGLTTVVMQYASHEMAHVRWTAHGTLEGDSRALGRLRALRALATRWFAAAAVLVVLVVTPIGLAVLRSRPEVAEVAYWAAAWTVLVVATALTLAVTPALAMLEGCGRVREVARFRLVQDLLAFGVCWLLLLRGAGVMSYAALAVVRALASVAWSTTAVDRPWRALAPSDPSVAGAMWHELWPMQWRIAVSWVSGVFIFQVLPPIAFMVAGAVAAGQLGMTLTVTSTVTTLAASWLGPKAPVFGALIARARFAELHSLFRRTLLQALASALAGAVVVFAGALLVSWHLPAWRERLLEPTLVALLLAVAVANVAITGLATYLRAF